ncbi:MAG TPA: hypothetical protein VN420_02850 [Candidatus Fimivivens sp.]|nr:hypothetical protein [Candidatus Fimivivens sp.]
MGFETPNLGNGSQRGDGDMSRRAFLSKFIPGAEDRTLSKKEHASELLDTRLENIHALRDRMRVTLDSLKAMDIGSMSERQERVHFETLHRTEGLLQGIDRQLESLRSTKETSVVRTSDADFRMVYENHTQQHSPEVLRDLDAYCYEGMKTGRSEVDERSKHDLLRRYEKYLISDNIGGPINSLHYKGKDTNTVDVIRETKIPMFILDVYGLRMRKRSEADFADEAVVDSMIAAFAILAGASQSVKMSIDVIRELMGSDDSDTSGRSDNMTRRDFLSLVGRPGIIALAGAFLELNVFSDVKERTMNETSIYRDAYKLQKRALVTLGFLQLGISFRNAVIAQKLQTVSGIIGGEVGGKRPFIGMETGCGHFGIEDFLIMSEEKRLSFIRDMAEKLDLKLWNPDLEVAAIFRHVYDDERKLWTETYVADPGISRAFQGYPIDTTPVGFGEGKTRPIPGSVDRGFRE